MQLPPVHLVVMQPPGHLHSLAYLDHARYFRYQFRRMGAEVTLAKNRLREDAVNFVFGAHLGFDVGLTERHDCIFVNFESLASGHPSFSRDYRELLSRSAVIDHDPANAAAYGQQAENVPVLAQLHAPYLSADATGVPDMPLEERPIDLLFFGSMNPRRRAFLDRVERSGAQVAMFDQPVYGEERDAYIRQAKAVINAHLSDNSRFEQARAFQALSLGTPVISERHGATLPPSAYEDSVFWLDSGEAIDRFFTETFRTPAFFQAARSQLQNFRRFDPLEGYADALAFAAGYRQVRLGMRQPTAWQPSCLHLGAGTDYKSGWLNMAASENGEPDVVLDLSQPIQLPLHMSTRGGGEVLLHPGSLQTVYASYMPGHVPALPRLMANVLALLKEGGVMDVELPCEVALNGHAWSCYTDRFWEQGWFEHRFEIAATQWLDTQLIPCAKDQAAFMRVQLRKTATSVQERMAARARLADFGGVPEDAVVTRGSQALQMVSYVEALDHLCTSAAPV